LSYFLDTNICIYFLKGQFAPLIEAFHRKQPDSIKIPAIVKAELLYGIEKSTRKTENRSLCNRFLDPFEIVDFDDESATHYATIRYSLEKRGKIIGPNDLIIASTVIAHNGVLVTHNTKEFKVVSGLTIEDWTV
jgi:tRNA(fMet)-specific endonuclease VapC